MVGFFSQFRLRVKTLAVCVTEGTKRFNVVSNY